ncbi:YoaK family protein [Salinifilum aidingensis]
MRTASTRTEDGGTRRKSAPPPEVRAERESAGRQGLPPALMGLTVISGIIDAVSYLGLGRLFLGKMTGNVVVLGLSTAQVPGFSLCFGALALTGFLLGAAGGGRLHTALGHERFRWVSTALVVEAAALTGAAAVAAVSSASSPHLSPSTAAGLVALLALAMGFRNATVRKLGVADMTTTLITLTLADLAADSFLAGKRNPRLGRRVGVVLSIFGGAALGGALVFHHGLVLPLVISASLAGGLAAAYPVVVTCRARNRWRSRRGAEQPTHDPL